MIQLQAIAPDGLPRGEIIQMRPGSILVVHMPDGATRVQREDVANGLADIMKPDERFIVLPHGYRLEVVQPVETSVGDAARTAIESTFSEPGAA